MNALIINYRRGRKTQKTNQMIIEIEKVKSKEEAEKFVGKKVEFHCEGKQKKIITGTISKIHGNSGAMRVLFNTGMPGQSIGGDLKVL